MKKLMFLVFASVLLVLGACSGDDDDNQSIDDPSNDVSSGENEENVGEDNLASEDSEAEDAESENQETDEPEDTEEKTDSELTDFPEYDSLVDEIDVDSLQAEIEADNSNKRVILYADDNDEKVYKSIFIKNKDRLKIIDFKDDGEIFNEIIK